MSIPIYKTNRSGSGDSNSSSSRINLPSTNLNSRIQNQNQPKLKDFRSNSINSTSSSINSDYHLAHLDEGNSDQEEEEEDQDFYRREFVKGSFKTQSYPSLKSNYFISYSQASLNWDSLLNSAFFNAMKTGSASFLPSKNSNGEMIAPKIPKRVLNLGSGFPFWELEMVKMTGWEEVEFFCLDLAPYSIPEATLPLEMSSRITFIQHDFLDGLPFENDSFDFVRIAYCGIGIPGKFMLKPNSNKLNEKIFLY